MNNFIFACSQFLMLLMVSCAHQKNIYLKNGGVFVNLTDSNKVIVIENSRFTILDYGGSIHSAKICCDTIAFGSIKYDNRGFLILSSDPSLTTFFINSIVNEKKDFSDDSIYFNIENPIEDNFRKFNSGPGRLIYELDVQPEGGTAESFKENNRDFESSKIRFYNPEKIRIYSFSISIKPKESPSLGNRYITGLRTEIYKVKNENSNVFNINIPLLTDGFLVYRRLDEVYLKIENENNLKWEGDIYRKKN